MAVRVGRTYELVIPDDRVMERTVKQCIKKFNRLAVARASGHSIIVLTGAKVSILKTSKVKGKVVQELLTCK